MSESEEDKGVIDTAGNPKTEEVTTTTEKNIEPGKNLIDTAGGNEES